jgi:hypothetical protein
MHSSLKGALTPGASQTIAFPPLLVQCISLAFARTEVTVKATTSVLQAAILSAFDTHSRNAPIPLLQMHL